MRPFDFSSTGTSLFATVYFNSRMCELIPHLQIPERTIKFSCWHLHIYNVHVLNYIICTCKYRDMYSYHIYTYIDEWTQHTNSASDKEASHVHAFRQCSFALIELYLKK